MKKLIASLLIVSMLSGCAALGSKQAAVVCQGADLVSTVVAIKGGAVEAGPIAKPLYKAFGLGGIVGLKLLVLYILLTYHDDIPENSRAVVNAVTCAAAANNIGIISGQ